MLKKAFVIFLAQVISLFSVAQEDRVDTTIVLKEIILKAFEQNNSSRSSAIPVHHLDIKKSGYSAQASFLPVLNTVPGVRMEERSPGSYRINIRGSSLRSPFGVRNIKVYWNEIPVTDAGGNTYINQFAWNNIASMEIFKGPAGSMYGAGTGGLLILNPISHWEPGINATYSYGSYTLQNILVTARYGRNENMNLISYAHNGYDGYREQSRMRRDNISWVTQLKLSERQQFTASILYTDLYYQTPGGLTLSEFNTRPKSARPATGVFPSAATAKASIKQSNFLAGFTHHYKLNAMVSNQTTFFGTFTELSNPSIRNYERRTEPGFGGRSLFIYKDKEDRHGLKVIAGGEFQHGFFNTIVFRNNQGKPDTLQTNDDIVFTLNSYFIQGEIAFRPKWFINGGVSVNRSKVTFSRLNQIPVIKRIRYYRDELAPRLSVKRILTDQLMVDATLSKGFSPPTIAELLPSTSVISTHLEAELGWNHEIRFTYLLFEKRLKLEAGGFLFKLKNALVQRRDSSGADYFVNSGSIRQKGIESRAEYEVDLHKGLIRALKFQAAFSFNHFRYGKFIRGSADYSGKIVPSVPSNSIYLAADLSFKKEWHLSITYYGAGTIYLNDENTAFAKPYHLPGVRFGWEKNIKQKFVIHVFSGADNLLDEKYSLGHDINAVSGRFYNPAPRRNFYTGVSFQWISKRK